MKTQEYDVTYWPIGKPTEKTVAVLAANGKEDALDVARRTFGVNYSFKIKRKNYNWTGKGIVTLFKQKEADPEYLYIELRNLIKTHGFETVRVALLNLEND